MASSAAPMRLRCASCGATNRVDPQKVAEGKAARCGRCQAPLGAGGEPISVTDASFASDVEASPIPVLVDAWAPWCGPCRQIAPVVEQLAHELAGRVRVAKLNVDENPRTAARFQVQSIPTLLVIAGGREVDRIVGLHPKAEIARRLERVISAV